MLDAASDRVMASTFDGRQNPLRGRGNGRHTLGMVESLHIDGRAGIHAWLVKRLVATQFPQWSDLPVTPVEVDGWDNGPQAGAHSFHRGASLAYYDDETRRSLAVLGGRIDTDRASAVWDAALDAAWPGPPVWFPR